MTESRYCARCDGALLLERKGWRCTHCGVSGIYVEHWHRGKRLRVLFTRPTEEATSADVG